jgi:hypothetical protein
MSDNRYSQVPPQAVVFRLAAQGGAFLPKSETIPTEIGWLAPTAADKREAEEAKRVAGLSAWDHEQTTAEQAIEIRLRATADSSVLTNDSEEVQVACYCDVADVHRVVNELQQHNPDASFSINFVRDPLEFEPPLAGQDGHVLIEGLERPNGVSRALYRELRAKLLRVFRATP